MTPEEGGYQMSGYWCVVCMRYIEPDEDGVMVHDGIWHPPLMDFTDEDHPQ